MKLTNELKRKLLTANNAEEMAGLVEADGQVLTPEDASRLWEEIEKISKQEGTELSLDELEAVSGGYSRNWVTEGCAASVEFGSFCGSNDNCIWREVVYDYGPTGVICPNCGKNMYLQNTISLGGDKYERQFRCKYCGCIISKTNYEIDPGHH